MKTINLAVYAAVFFVPAACLAAWEQESSRDEMRGTLTQSMQTTSINTVNFDPPYKKNARAMLVIRQQNGTTSVIVVMESGQLLCHITGCSASIKFDDSPVKSVQGSPPDSHRSDVVFLTGTASLIAQMKKAKTLKVELPFYQSGKKVFTFNVEKLDWPPNKPSSPRK